MNDAGPFLSGFTMAVFAACALFFLKFWKSSRDRFFLLFSVACALIAIERAIALFEPGTQEAVWSAATEAVSWVYLIRLAAFLTICFAVYGKNRAAQARISK